MNETPDDKAENCSPSVNLPKDYAYFNLTDYV